MIALETYIVNTIINDATMQGFLATPNQPGKYSVYPTDVDIEPENFPAITFQDVANIIRTSLAGFHIGILQLNFWSVNNAYEIEQMYEQVEKLFNLKDGLTSSQTFNGILFWIRENDAKDLHSPGRRLWHKIIDLKYWANNPTAY